MKKELWRMSVKEMLIETRIKQLQQYRQLKTSVEGAKIILKFACLYHLEGDFRQIEEIALVGIKFVLLLHLQEERERV